jgi:hypothetical protein
MQPQPLSEEKPVGSESVLLILTENERADVALGSTDFGMGSNPDLYVIQNFDAISSKNPEGHPPSRGSSSPATADERLLEVEAGGVSGAFTDVFDTDGGFWVGDEVVAASSSQDSGASWPTDVVFLFTVLELVYLASSSL